MHLLSVKRQIAVLFITMVMRTRTKKDYRMNRIMHIYSFYVVKSAQKYKLIFLFLYTKIILNKVISLDEPQHSIRLSFISYFPR